MSISYVASTVSSALSNTSRDVGDPAGTQENDFYIAVCSIKDDANAGAWATPADWTKLDEQHYSTLGSSDLLTAVFYRRRGGIPSQSGDYCRRGGRGLGTQYLRTE